MSSFVHFITKDEAQIEYVTTIVINEIKHDIYKKKINNCHQYFKIIKYYKYIGYVENDMFFVVSLENDSFDNEFKEKFDNINNTNIYLFKEKYRNLMREERNDYEKIIDTFGKNYEHLSFSEECNDLIDLDNLDKANKILDKLNNILNCTNYEIKLNYIFQSKKILKLMLIVMI